MAIGPAPMNADLTVTAGSQPSAPWRAWLTRLNLFTQAMGGSGATGSRPSTGLYVGLQYFDSTLGYPVWVRTVGPPTVWVNSSGGAV
jgi:hypothetical protein